MILHPLYISLVWIIGIGKLAYMNFYQSLLYFLTTLDKIWYRKFWDNAEELTKQIKLHLLVYHKTVRHIKRKECQVNCVYIIMKCKRWIWVPEHASYRRDHLSVTRPNNSRHLQFALLRFKSVNVVMFKTITFYLQNAFIIEQWLQQRTSRINATLCAQRLLWNKQVQTRGKN